MRELFVIVSGAPGSGKSTLARDLAPALDLPLIEKDVIKEALAAVLGAKTPEDCKRLGAATMRVIFALAKANVGAVLESTWIPELSRPELAALKSRIVEVFVDVPVDEALRRYNERAGSRHQVHFDHNVDVDAFAERAQPVAGDWPVIQVDGTRDVDTTALVDEILHAS